MSSPLTIVANIEAHPGKGDLLKSELMKLLEPTRAEPGCIQYDLHQNNDKPEHFLFFEKWKNRDLWQDHMKMPHIEAYLKVAETIVKSFVVHEMTFIN